MSGSERPTDKNARRSYEEQVHFMNRQAQMLAEEGNDVSSRVMQEALAMLAVEHHRAEEATRKYNLSSSVESQARAWEKVYEVLLRLFGDKWYEGRGGLNAADSAVAKIEELAAVSHVDAPREDVTRLEWLDELMRHCPHADLTYNDDDDGMDGPQGFSLIVEGCSRLELHAPTLAGLIDLGMNAKPDEDGNVEASVPSSERAKGATPRTDAIVKQMIAADELVPSKLASHAEQLERDLAEAMDRCDEALASAEEAVRQRDAADKRESPREAGLEVREAVRPDFSVNGSVKQDTTPASSTDAMTAALQRLCDLKRMKVALEQQRSNDLDLSGGTVKRADIQRYYDENKEAAWQQAFDALSWQPSATDATKNAARYEYMRVHGCALAGSEALNQGLVQRCVNLDEAVDAAMARSDGTGDKK